LYFYVLQKQQRHQDAKMVEEKAGKIKEWVSNKLQQVLLLTSWWFSPGPLVSSTNKTDRHNITEILLKVALNTIKQANKQTNKPSEAHRRYLFVAVIGTDCIGNCKSNYHTITATTIPSE
jgi:hypothetical protein